MPVCFISSKTGFGVDEMFTNLAMTYIQTKEKKERQQRERANKFGAEDGYQFYSLVLGLLASHC